ncbi:Aspartate aminotransferase like protein [Argiope bruennichi]|uniref:Aspartate aminotransferase like protein n=1 Tax=Argiope bruennichi TaxID=94029 RepID=A0A8T0EKF4_ARGBR|nr:Aspartate aminotransferase like protein [Argiope bruennichi]
MSYFICVENAPTIEVFALRNAFDKDSFPDKVDLGIGAYRTDEGQPWVLPVVRKIEQVLAEDDSLIRYVILGQNFLKETPAQNVWVM